MSEPDGYGPGVLVPSEDADPERLPCRVAAAPPVLGSAAFMVSRRSIASQGA